MMVVSVMLSACQMPFEEPIHTKLNVPYASNKEDQYLESKNGKDLQVKAPLTTSNMSGFYNLPPAPKNAEVSIKPSIS